MLITDHSASRTAETAAIVSAHGPSRTSGATGVRRLPGPARDEAVVAVAGLDSVTRRVSPDATCRFHYPVRSRRHGATGRGDRGRRADGYGGRASARSRGRAVVLLERFTFGHAKGSSGGTTRNFRLTYHDPVYVRMARLALERWRELEEVRSGAPPGRRRARRGRGDRCVGGRARGGRRCSNDPRPPRWRSGGRSLRFDEGSSSCISPRERSCGRTRRSRPWLRLGRAAGAELREGTRSSRPSAPWARASS